VCQHAAFEQGKTARLSEARGKLNAALERVVEAHDLENKGFKGVSRARREECARLRVEMERLDEEYATKTWTMEAGIPGRRPLKGKRTVKKGERLRGGSMLKCETRAEEVVSVDENDGRGREEICGEPMMSASDEYELDALPLTTLAITEEERRQIDADNADWYEAFSITDTEVPAAWEADEEAETGPPNLPEEQSWQIAIANTGWCVIAEPIDYARANAAIAEMDACATPGDWDLNVTTPAITAIREDVRNPRPPVHCVEGE